MPGFSDPIDHVGSLVRPPELMHAVQEAEAGSFPADELRRLQDKHIAEIVAMQVRLGLPVITDGEFRRRSWQRGMLDALGGIAIKPGPLTFRNDRGVTNPQPAVFIERRLERRRGIATEEFKAVAALTSRACKVTMPAPTIFHLGLFSQCADRSVYPDLDILFTDLIAIYRQEMNELAALGCRHIQFDEVALPTMVDPRNQSAIRQFGEEPEQVIDFYVRLDRELLTLRPAGLTIGMHLCRGNQAGLWSAEGGYDDIAERLFNDIPADVYLMEYDSPRAGDFAPLRHLPKDKRVLLGLISTKQPDVETADSLMARIEEAARFAPIEQLGLCTQCGFASSISRWNKTQNPMTEVIQEQKLARLVEVGTRAWH